MHKELDDTTLIDVTSFDSKQREFIEVPNHGTVEIFRNAPFSITTSAAWPPVGKSLVYIDTYEVDLPDEPVETLPWDTPTPPAPPRGFENLPTRK